MGQPIKQTNRPLVPAEDPLVFFHQSPNPMLILNAKDLAILDANQAAADLYGIPEPELRSMNFCDLLHPDGRCGMDGMVERLLGEKNEPGALGVMDLHRRKDGSGINVEVVTHPVQYNGQTARVATIIDVTERERARRAMWESELRWRSVIESSSEGNIILGLDGRIQDFNRLATRHSRAFFKRELKAGGLFLDYLYPEYRESLQTLFQAALEGQVNQVERLFHTEKGDTWYRVTHSPVYDEQGHVEAVCLAALCIDEQKKAEEAIHRRIEFEQLMTQLSAAFINLPASEVDEGIRRALQTLAEYDRTDGCWIMMRDEDATSVSLTHEWLSPGLASSMDKLQHIPMIAFPWILQNAEKGVPIRLDRVADIPPEAVTERDLFREIGVKSWLAVPVRQGGQLVGLVGFDMYREARAWSEDSAALLRVAGEMFINAIGRKRMEDALRHSEASLRAVFNSGQYGIVFVDQGLRIRTVNRRAQELSRLILGQELSLGQPVFDFHPDTQHPIMRNYLTGVLEGNTYRREMHARDRAGKEHWIDLHMNPVKGDHGEVRGVCIMMMLADERKMFEEILKDSEEKFRLLFNSAHDFIYLNELEADGSLGRFAEVNEIAGQRLGRTRDEFLALRFSDVVLPGGPSGQESARKDLLSSGTATFEEVHAGRSGVAIPVEVNSRVILWNSRQMVLSIARDITERKRAEETIRRQAYYDVLTSLPNRALFKDRLSQALNHARRNRQSLAVLILDLDRFKTINETLGHVVGDKLLVGVSERLLTVLREGGETIARLGGDEFAILLPQLGLPEDAVEYAKRILRALQDPFRFENHDLHVTTSIGISAFPVDGEEAETLLKNAETAMYRAKEQGRDNYQSYASIMNASAFKRLLMENNLRRGVEQREFTVHYQPIVDLKNGHVVGVEALARWQHPDLGLIFPMEFIPLAEETGLIVPMGEHIIGLASHETQRLRQKGFPHLYVAVNLSARQFQHQDLTDTIRRILGETGLPANHLMLEITESIAMKNADTTVALLNELTQLGDRLALDDFGTGYSSLSYLKKFPIQILKIDQSFVRDTNTDPNDAAIVTAVIAMAHSLKLLVVAEGVENEAQLEFLRKHHCDFAQGYLISHPLPADELELFLRKGAAKP